MTTLASIAIAVPLGGWRRVRHPRLSPARAPDHGADPRPDADRADLRHLIPILFRSASGRWRRDRHHDLRHAANGARNHDARGRAARDREYGTMAGTTPRQMLFKVMLPAARPQLLVGVNQVIMLSLNMVIIASMIGAGGLGYDVLTSLRRLDIGRGLEAGLGIVLLAIALDRLSQAYATRRATGHQDDRTFVLALLGFTAAVYVIGLFVPAVAIYPASLQLSTAPW
jgi:hypothetical protein